MYGRRTAQGLGIDVTRYAVLNIHRIGIEAAVAFVRGGVPCQERVLIMPAAAG